jgi:transposase-like protein
VTSVRQRRGGRAQEPGAVASAVAREAGIQASQLFRWRRQLHLLLAGGLLAARVFVRIAASEDNEPPEHQSRRERIILIGANRFASSFIQLLNAYAPQQQRVIAVLDEKAAMIGRAIQGCRYLERLTNSKRLSASLQYTGSVRTGS